MYADRRIIPHQFILYSLQVCCSPHTSSLNTSQGCIPVSSALPVTWLFPVTRKCQGSTIWTVCRLLISTTLSKERVEFYSCRLLTILTIEELTFFPLHLGSCLFVFFFFKLARNRIYIYNCLSVAYVKVVRDEIKQIFYNQILGFLNTGFSLFSLPGKCRVVICNSISFSATNPCLLFYPHPPPPANIRDIASGNS